LRVRPAFSLAGAPKWAFQVRFRFCGEEIES
jgi:hypothetical protein